MSSLQALAGDGHASERIQALSLVLNVGQAVALAWIASRSTRVRRTDVRDELDDD